MNRVWKARASLDARRGSDNQETVPRRVKTARTTRDKLNCTSGSGFTTSSVSQQISDPDNSCKYGITGRNCIYQFVSEDTIGTNFAASQRPSPLMKREKPYVLEAECPTCDASNCGGCIDGPNCVQAGCTWTPGTLEGEEVDRGTCA